MTLKEILNAPFIIVVRVGHIHVGNGNPDDPGQSVKVYLVRSVLAWKELGKAVDGPISQNHSERSRSNT